MVALLFFLSGATALIYEIVWIRLFAVSFGNTAQAMSTVLGVYLGGIAAGAALARKFVRRPAPQCLRLYGFAEILTSIYALAIPSLLHAAGPLFQALYGTGRGSTLPVILFRATLGSVILFPATLLMGATLPFLAGWISGSEPAEAGRRVNTLYSV